MEIHHVVEEEFMALRILVCPQLHIATTELHMCFGIGKHSVSNVFLLPHITCFIYCPLAQFHLSVCVRLVLWRLPKFMNI